MVFHQQQFPLKYKHGGIAMVALMSRQQKSTTIVTIIIVTIYSQMKKCL